MISLPSQMQSGNHSRSQFTGGGALQPIVLDHNGRPSARAIRAVMRGQSKAVVRTLNVGVRSVSIAAQPEAAPINVVEAPRSVR